MNEEQAALEPGFDKRSFGIQTEPPKEDVVEKPPEYEYGAQTDFFIDRPVIQKNLICISSQLLSLLPKKCW